MVEVAQQTQQKARSGAPPSRFRWTRERYERLVEAGVLTPEDRVELIDGEIVEMSPQGSRHYTFMENVVEALKRAYAEGFVVRMQGPLALGPDSEPEPDVAVVPGSRMDYFDQHPTQALLVVEVADTSLLKDRLQKEPLYAQHDVAEYWILNVSDENVEVYRDPDAAGQTYQTKTTLQRGDTIQPTKAPRSVSVEALLLSPKRTDD